MSPESKTPIIDPSHELTEGRNPLLMTLEQQAEAAARQQAHEAESAPITEPILRAGENVTLNLSPEDMANRLAAQAESQRMVRAAGDAVISASQGHVEQQ